MTVDRPVFVTGAPRSGKTLIARALGRASEFAYVEEPLWIWGGLPRIRHADVIPPEAATPRVRKYVWRSCRQAVAQLGFNRYVDDYAYHALSLPFLHQVFPDLRVIHVVRSPATAIPEIAYGWTRRERLRAEEAAEGPDATRQPLHVRRHRELRNALRSFFAARAMMRFTARAILNETLVRLRGRRWSFGPRAPVKGAGSATSAFEMAALQWAGMVQTARVGMQALPCGQRLEIRYEDLIAFPEATFEKIATVVELRTAPDRVRRIGRTVVKPTEEVRNPSRMFARSPSEEEWKQLWPIVRDVATRYGYEAPFTESS